MKDTRPFPDTHHQEAVTHGLILTNTWVNPRGEAKVMRLQGGRGASDRLGRSRKA